MTNIQKTFHTILKNNKAVLIIFFLFSLWLTLEYVILGPFSYVRLGDNLDSMVPRYLTLWQDFFRYGSTFWQPLFNGGIDRLANCNYYTLISVLPFAFLPGWLSLGINLIGSIFLGGYFLYLLCHDILKLDKVPSILSSFIYMFVLIETDIIPLMEGVSILPVVIYYLEKWHINSTYNRYYKVLLLGIIFSLFPSIIATLPFVLITLAIWFFIIRRYFSISFVILFIICILPSLLLSSGRIWNLIIHAPLSQRSGDTGGYFNAGFDIYIFWIKKIINENILSIVILVIGSIFFWIRRIKPPIFLWSLLLLCLYLFIAPTYQPLATLFGDNFKVIRDVGLDRFYLLVPFFASICTAYIFSHFKGFVKLENEHHNATISVPLHSILLYTFTIALFIQTLNLKWLHVKNWLVMGSYYSNTYSPDVAYIASLKKDQEPFRVASFSRVASPIVPTLAQFHRLESIDGHANITTRENIDLFRLVAKDQTIKSSMYFFYDSSAAPENIKSFEQDSSRYFSPALMSLANVKYVLTTIPLNAPGFKLVNTPSSSTFYNWEKETPFNKIKVRLKENFTGRQVLVYENLDVLPRFYLTKKTQVFDTKVDLENGLKEASASALKEYAYLLKEDSTDLSLSGTNSNGTIEVKQYSPDIISLNIHTDNPALLVVTNNYSPFWKAYVNDKEQHVYKAYLSYMAVPVTETDREVILKYEPPYKYLKFL